MSKRVRTRSKLIGDTPLEAPIPLIPHLPPGVRFWEPCAGQGNLIWALNGHAECVCATDVAPRAEGIFRLDAMAVALGDVDHTGAEMIITNPPFPTGGAGGLPTVPMILHLAAMRPTWMLLPHDFSANRYFGRVSAMCVKWFPIGRVSWLGNGKPGFENAAWYLFDAQHVGATRFIARVA